MNKIFTLCLLPIWIASVAIDAGSGPDSVIGSNDILQPQQAPYDPARIDLELEEIRNLQKYHPVETADGAVTAIRIRELLRRATVADYREGYLEALYLLAGHFLDRSLPDSALVAIEEGLAAGRDWRGSQSRFSILGAEAAERSGDHAGALRFRLDAIGIADSLNLRGDLASLHLQTALSYRQLGEEGLAFEHLHHSYLLSEAEGDSVTLASVMLEVGRLYQDFENSSDAIWYLDQARRISRKTGEAGTLAASLLHLAVSQRISGDPAEAGLLLDEARSIADDTGLKLRIDYERGRVKSDLGRYDTARELITVAMEMNRHRNDLTGLYLGAIAMGELERSTGRHDAAVAWFESALAVARDLKSGTLEGRSLEELYRTYRESERDDRALDWLEELLVHESRQEEAVYERARAEYETRFETRRREQENRLLLARQAEQEAEIRLQRTMVAGGSILLGLLTFGLLLLFGSARARKQLNRELREKNSDLEKLNRVKNRLFAVIAHDLRGPLNALQGLLYLIRKKKVSGDQLEKLTDRLERNLQENASTMENLLTWAKSQMSGIHFEYRRCDPIEIGREVCGQFRFLADRKSVSLNLETEPGISVHLDPDVFRMILRNLIANAIKFSRAGGEVVISLKRSGEELVVSVADNGVGISRENREKIFADGHYSTRGTENEKGSGLGLELCREFVNRHGGRIWFESEVGKGTTFWFTLSERATQKSDSGEQSAQYDTGAEDTQGVSEPAGNGSRRGGLLQSG